MKVRHKHTGHTGIPLDRAIDGRILVCWDKPKPLLNDRQHPHNLVFIVPARGREISQLDAWKFYGLPHPKDKPSSTKERANWGIKVNIPAFKPHPFQRGKGSWPERCHVCGYGEHEPRHALQPEPLANMPHTFKEGSDGLTCSICDRGYLAAIHWSAP